MTSDTKNELAKRATITLRRFQTFRLMRQNLQRARQLKAENIEKMKYMAPVVNKLCPSSTDPHKDCFSMTLDVTPPTSSYAKPIPTPNIAMPTLDLNKIVTVDFPNCVALRPFLVLKCNDLCEAVIFYKTAFGAEVIQLPKKRKREEDTITSEAVLKIGGQTFLLNNSVTTDFSRDGAHFSLLTDDVDSVVDKASKAGASLSGKLVEVYSKCRICCKLVKVVDPYGNVWIIQSKLCSACLQSFVLLV